MLVLLEAAVNSVLEEAAADFESAQVKHKCIYCGSLQEPTKEHLLPKSAGGVYKVRACRPCNRTRGNSGTWKPFRAYIAAHPDDWCSALHTRKSSDKLLVWLLENDLIHARMYR
jgi:hypothetical protein